MWSDPRAIRLGWAYFWSRSHFSTIFSICKRDWDQSSLNAPGDWTSFYLFYIQQWITVPRLQQSTQITAMQFCNIALNYNYLMKAHQTPLKPQLHLIQPLWRRSDDLEIFVLITCNWREQKQHILILLIGICISQSLCKPYSRVGSKLKMCVCGGLGRGYTSLTYV